VHSNNTPQPGRSTILRIPSLSALISLECLAAAVWTLRHASEPQAAVAFGYSWLRLGMAGVLIAMALLSGGLCAALLVSGGRRPPVESWISDAGNRRKIIAGALALAAAAWLGLFLPAYRLGAIGGYAQDLHAVMILVLLAASETIVFLYLENSTAWKAHLQTAFRKNARALTGWAIIMAIMLLTWGFIASSRLGIDPRHEDYWYEPGVPLLGLTVFAALIIGSLAAIAEARRAGRGRSGRTDLIVFLLIWCISGLIWMRTSAPNGWFNPGPFPPTQQTYPFSDAAKYDLESQFALIGQGLDNGGPSARPVYPAFLVLIHVLSGQDYDQNMRLQAALFGIFPAIVYLMGSSLLNRSAGFAAAAALCLRGAHAIAATDLLDLANAKQMLADFPAGIGIALSLLLCSLWFRWPQKMLYPLLAGGVIAFTVYLRPTSLAIVPPILLFAYIACARLPRKWFFGGAALLLAGYVLASAPWELRGPVLMGTSPYPSSLRKIITTFRHRFQIRDEGNPPGQQDGEPSQSGVETPGQETNEQPVRGDTIRPAPAMTPAVITNHFFRNVVTSILILPNSLTFHDMSTTIGAQNSYWARKWDGALSAEQSGLLALGLGCVALGMLAALRRSLPAGLLPAGAFLGYQAANALGRTSGGRYIVPVDWIVVLYLSIGLLQGVSWFLRSLGLLAPAEGESRAIPGQSSREPGGARALILPAIGLFLAGALLILPDLSFPRAFEPSSDKELTAEIFSNAAGQPGASYQAYADTLLQHGGAAASGKIMYPRYSAGNANGEFFFESTRTTIAYPLLAFSLIGPQGQTNVRLPGPLPANIHNYGDAIVVGCRQATRFEAVLVVMNAPRRAMYVRQPLPPPACPLPEPICDNNGNCR